MPVSAGSKLNLPRAIAFAVGSLVAGVALLFAIVALAGSGEVQFKLGDDVFDAGNAEARSDRIAEDGTPLLFPSLSNDRPLYLQHLGIDPATGWFAIDARSPTDPDACPDTLLWIREDRVFQDPCGGETYPADGAGLLQYPVEVNAAGDLIVDLNADGDADPETENGADDG